MSLLPSSLGKCLRLVMTIKDHTDGYCISGLKRHIARYGRRFYARIFSVGWTLPRRHSLRWLARSWQRPKRSHELHLAQFVSDCKEFILEGPADSNPSHQKLLVNSVLDFTCEIRKPPRTLSAPDKESTETAWLYHYRMSPDFLSSIVFAREWIRYRCLPSTARQNVLPERVSLADPRLQAPGLAALSRPSSRSSQPASLNVEA